MGAIWLFVMKLTVSAYVGVSFIIMVVFVFLYPKLVGAQRKALKKNSQISDISSFQLYFSKYSDLWGTLRTAFCSAVIFLWGWREISHKSKNTNALRLFFLEGKKSVWLQKSNCNPCRHFLHFFTKNDSFYIEQNKQTKPPFLSIFSAMHYLKAEGLQGDKL